MSSSMFNNNSISISVSDEESSELGRMQERVRIKRKKQQVHRVRNEFSRRVVRFLLKYWMVLVFLPAAGLLVFEASRIGKKPSLDVELEHDVKKTPDLKINQTVDESKKKMEENLDRLDPPRCLKLLPPEELQHLEIPMHDESSPVKNVVYISEKAQHEGGNSTLSQLRSEGTRFNLFSGEQTLDERERSFKVSETAQIHCGFYSENGGFKISGEDKIFMQTCKVVVSTCAFGGGDDLYQPIGMLDTSLQKVCYVAFWDEITLAAQELKRHRIGEDHFIGKWRIVVVRDLPFIDQRLNGKIPKMLGHRLFPHAKFSIWVDSKSQFRRDPLGVLEALLWRSNSVLAISQHGARSNVYEEATAVVKKHKASPEEVEVQLTQYRQDGLPEDKRFNGKKGIS
ncbi:probable hexosyltransferase MUCI70 isoform X2 [Hevea brasiliensis]|uniref:probable hexosyltransferase MUCI70 isoform X2 n=1 Tax=Hevea brasiliensis TaxID=3981 RepID=UPI0025D73BC0|nr:probable hexosyltransferase MUCI70 isoform X2 [Hevea brasiliensis]